MTTKIFITLDDEVVRFIDSQGTNRSKVVNDFLQKIKKEQLQEELKAAYIDQNLDPNFCSEFKLWECTTADGLDADE